MPDVEITKVEEPTTPRGYVRTNEQGTLRRETPKVKGKAAVKAAKRNRIRPKCQFCSPKG